MMLLGLVPMALHLLSALRKAYGRKGTADGLRTVTFNDVLVERSCKKRSRSMGMALMAFRKPPAMEADGRTLIRTTSYEKAMMVFPSSFVYIYTR